MAREPIEGQLRLGHGNSIWGAQKFGVPAVCILVCTGMSSPIIAQTTQPLAASPQQTPATPTATAPSVNQPGSAAPVPLAPKETKETKETVESKEIHDHPSDWAEITSAVAWPIAVLLIVIISLISIARSNTIKGLVRGAVSLVRSVEIGGVKMEIDTSVVAEVKKFLGDSMHELAMKAKGHYDQLATATSVDEKLRNVVRVGLQEILKKNNLAQWPPDLRATVHVPDIVFKDYLYQLVDYYPGPERHHPLGRRFSQRFGIIGRAWRLGRSIGRGKAVSGTDAASQLIMDWGMQPREADDHSHLQPANLCVILFDQTDNKRQVGLLYVNSTKENAFGVDPPTVPPVAAAPSPGTTPPHTADEVALEVQNHQLTQALARAVAQVIVPLQSAGPALDVTNIRSK